MARRRHRPRHSRHRGGARPTNVGPRLLHHRVPPRQTQSGPPIRVASMNVNGLTLQSAWGVETLILALLCMYSHILHTRSLLLYA